MPERSAQDTLEARRNRALKEQGLSIRSVTKGWALFSVCGLGSMKARVRVRNNVLCLILQYAPQHVWWSRDEAS